MNLKNGTYGCDLPTASIATALFFKPRVRMHVNLLVVVVKI